jgi:hypothetical protein
VKKSRLHDMLTSSDPKHRLTGATLAASMSRQQRRVTKEEWRDVVEGVDDPYIRAILRKIGGDGWEAVLSEDMAILDKISIAVCNLNDKEVAASASMTLSLLADSFSSPSSFGIFTRHHYAPLHYRPCA